MLWSSVAWIAAAALVALPMVSRAQGAAGAGSGAGATHGQRGASKEQQDFNRRLQQISDRLKLTEEQNPKVRSVYEAEALKAREIKTKFKGTPDTPENKAELKKEMLTLRTETNTQLKEILTPAQMTELQKMQEEEIKKMKEKEKGMKEGEAKSEPKGDDHH
jgi:Spy/CpxP family protein refolding chaperone